MYQSGQQLTLVECVFVSLELAFLSLLCAYDLQVGQDVHDLNVWGSVALVFRLPFDNFDHNINDSFDIAQCLSRPIVCILTDSRQEILFVLFVNSRCVKNIDVFKDACYIDRGILSGEYKRQPSKVFVQQ